MVEALGSGAWREALRPLLVYAKENYAGPFLFLHFSLLAGGGEGQFALHRLLPQNVVSPRPLKLSPNEPSLHTFIFLAICYMPGCCLICPMLRVGDCPDTKAGRVLCLCLLGYTEKLVQLDFFGDMHK